MKLLSIETSSSACSVALALDGELFDQHVVEPRAHTGILLPMIAGLLDEAGIVAADLDAVVLGNGPGSFIGMRIGASVAQGICFAAGLDIIPVSSLAAVAAEALDGSNAGRVLVAQDAHMNEVYVGAFRRGKNGLPVAEGDEFISAVENLAFAGHACYAAGDGWNRYPALMERGRDQVLGQLPIKFPRARCLLPMALAAADTAMPAAQLVPAYLRQKVATKPVQSAG